MIRLRTAAESVADAVNMRTRIHNRIRSGSGENASGEDKFVLLEGKGDKMELVTLRPGEKLTPAQIGRHPLGKAALNFEKQARDYLREVYELEVPEKVKLWAEDTPVIASGELFPRIVGLLGNPRYAIPMRMEGTGADRRAVPDGEPYDRRLHSLWQYAGRGDPDLAPVKGDQATLLRRGKITTVTPLLYTFSDLLVKAAGRSEEAKDSPLYKVYLEQKRYATGHDRMGDSWCEGTTWPYKCSVTHRRHAKVCKNRHIPPLSSNGCGVTAHPEWGEIGSTWRPGHCNAHALRIVQKEFLRQFWLAAEGTDW